MQVIFHTGAHATEEDRLLKSLQRNTALFAEHRIAVPNPGKFRGLFKDCFTGLDSGGAPGNAGEVLLDAILEEEDADRLVLSNPHLFGTQFSALEPGGFYLRAGSRMAALQQMFPMDELQMFIAIRNPATFMPAMLAKVSGQRQDDLITRIDPQALRWSEMIGRIRREAPEIPVTVWCYEDMPLIWGQILRELLGIQDGHNIWGGLDLLPAIMSREGMKRLRAYLNEHPQMNEVQKRRVIAAFLDKFVVEDALEEELDLPGWTAALVDRLTDLYDQDVDRLLQLPGVRLITP
jgi:hypothetical protein